MQLLYKAFYWIFLAAVVVVGGFLILSILPIPGHIEMKIVKSGSMTPAIPIGAVVVIKPESSYEVGQVITFGPDTATQIPTTHRIYAISGTGASELFTTKGDANDAPDPTQTPLSLVHGKVIFDIPYIGYILAFAKTKLGFLLLVGIPALAVCVEEAFKIAQELKDMRKRKSGEAHAPRQPLPRGSNAVITLRARVPEAYRLRAPYRVPVRPVRTLLVNDGITAPPMPDPKGPQPLRATYISKDTLRLQPLRRLNGLSGGITAMLAVAFMVALTTAGHAAGDTLSYYRSSETSPGNRFASGTYPVPVSTSSSQTTDTQSTPSIQSFSAFSADFTLPDATGTTDTTDASSSDATSSDQGDSAPPIDFTPDATSTDTTTDTTDASSSDPVVTPPAPPQDPSDDAPAPTDSTDDSSTTPSADSGS